MYMYIHSIIRCVYTSLYISTCFSLSLSLYIYIYIYIIIYIAVRVLCWENPPAARHG